MLATLVVALLTGLIAAIALTPIVRWAARRYGLVVRPRDDRWHLVPTALYGGVAIAVTTCVAVALAFASHPVALDRSVATAIVATAFAMFMVGVIDDHHGISPVVKLIAQIGGGSLLVWSGLVVTLTPWLSVNVLVTMFWFVGISNALNLLDNMDGVAAGVSAVAALGFAAMSVYSGDTAIATVALAIAGSALGFLVFNFKPATIFMGDAGSLFLGAALAGLGIAVPRSSGLAGPVVLLIPVLMLIVPIVDTTLVTVTRVLDNRSIAVGGRDHSTHRLVAMGLSETGVAALLYACGIFTAAIAILISRMSIGTAVWFGVLVLTAAFLFAAYLGTLNGCDVKPVLRRHERTRMLRDVFVRRRGFVVLLDMALFGTAYYGSFVIYFAGDIPARLTMLAASTLGFVIVLKIGVFHYFGVYRTPWKQSVLADVNRIGKATVLATLLLVFASFLAARGAQVPRAVFVMDMLITGAFTLAARTSYDSFERLRRRLGKPRVPALVLANRDDIDLLLTAVAGRSDLHWRPVGIIMDGDEHVGEQFHGVRVIARSSGLQNAMLQTDAGVIICSNGALSDEVRESLSGLAVRVVQFRAEFIPAAIPETRSDLQAASAGAR